MTNDSPLRPASRRPSTAARLAFAGGSLIALGGLMEHRSASVLPRIAEPITLFTDAQRAAVLQPLTMPKHHATKPHISSPQYTHWKDDPVNAVATPPEEGEWTLLDSLYDTKTVMRLGQPVHSDSLGGRDRPMLLSWLPDRFPADSVRVNALKGTLHVKDRLVLIWPVDKKWKRQEGPYIYGAPSQINVTESGDTLSDMPERQTVLPLSTSAHFNHPFGERFLYQPGNLHLLLAHAPPPKDGAFYDMSKLPLRTPQKQNPAKITFADIAQKYRICREMLHNIAHWAPRAQDKDYKSENNLFPLMTFWKESRENCLPPLDPTIINPYGYGGLPQFGLSNGTDLGVQKRNSLVALRSIHIVNEKREWRPLKIDGQTLRGPEDLLRNWKAQMVCYYTFLGSIQERMQDDFAANRHRPHMKGVTLFGVCMGAYLTGDASAVGFMRRGASKQDANHTGTGDYIRHFSELPMEAFRIPNIGLDAQTTELVTSNFAHTDQTEITPQDMGELARRALKPMAPDKTINLNSHAERMMRMAIATNQASIDTSKRR